MSDGTTLIIGASGLVGRRLLRRYRARGDRAVGTGLRHAEGGMPPLDITRGRDVRDMVEGLRPRTIILSAAATDVDGGERQPLPAYDVNVVGACHVAAAAAAVGARLIYLSTDYVFDGGAGPYAEAAGPNPVNAYGRQKLAAEGIVRALPGGEGLVVRTTWVFGTEAPPRNFAARLIARNRQGEAVRVPTDQFGNPTHAADLADAIQALDAGGATGTFHVAGSATLDRHSFALLVAEVFGLRTDLILPAATAELGQSAPRPLRGGLLVHKAEAFLGRPLATPLQGLLAMRREGVE